MIHRIFVPERSCARKKSWHIHCANIGKRPAIPLTRLKNAARRVLSELGVWKADVTVVLVPASVMQDLNKRFLSCDAATDVLAFPGEKETVMGHRSARRPCAGHRPSLTGEIYLGKDAVPDAAVRFSCSVQEELLRYLVHGILHLAGFDDQRPVNRRKMWDEQERILKKVLRES